MIQLGIRADEIYKLETNWSKCTGNSSEYLLN